MEEKHSGQSRAFVFVQLGRFHHLGHLSRGYCLRVPTIPETLYRGHESFEYIIEMFRYDIFAFFTFVVGRHITPSAISCRTKLVFGVFILLCQICQFVLALLWHFVAVYVLFLAPRAEGFVSQLIFIFSKQLHQDLFFSVCPMIFLLRTSAATAAVAVLLQLRARQIRMGSY